MGRAFHEGMVVRTVALLVRSHLLLSLSTSQYTYWYDFGEE